MPSMEVPPARRVWTRKPSGPLIGVVADSGQLARVASTAGIDFLMGLSAGIYRNHGASVLGGCLPFVNSNDMTEAWVCERIVPAAGSTPVFAGLLVGDPTCPIEERFERLRARGVSGIVNYPSLSLLDGTLRQIYEANGCTVEAEVELMALARSFGFTTFGFVGAEREVATRFVDSGIDLLIMTPGLTRMLEDIHERRDRLQHDILRLNEVLEEVRRRSPQLPCLVYGGPITSPEDLEQVYRQTTFDGFVGGSVYGRYPVESGLSTAIRRFQSVGIHPEGERQSGLGPMIGATPPMRELFRLIRRAAACDLNVCAEGESGVGKELVATSIHRLSSRSQGALVTLNCGAIPESLLESELFGHERGAFTGADRRRLGKFELANNGTLFLDEVGDLSLRAQVALLRAIQQREITRVGGNVSIPVNVRIVAATNQPLASLVDQGKFRADLYYRLNNLTLEVPPLRDRLDDIPLLVEPILANLRVQMSREFLDLSPPFHEKLRKHAWPGNLRELQHVIAQAALLEDGALLTGRHFVPSAGEASRFQANGKAAARTLAEDVGADLRESRRGRIRQALHEAEGNKSQAAEILGVSRKTLYAWLRELNESE
ncbi:sigma 54-interacting transcriptional regulator [Singulisphaera sp. PoT]|uniref:sigma 54-interacting transcriptional regulator n=1 Tax=Singulisphaera sp. PoT TaxID=3411797 RepID=UPI003BF51E59